MTPRRAGASTRVRGRGRGPAGALCFLTVVPGTGRPSAAALGWFPVVGAAVGLAVGGMWAGAALVWPPAVAAALVVGADLGLTGALHLDGLVDAADGLLPHLDRAGRLRVMAEPGVGAFGVAAGAVVLVLRFAALAALSPAPLLVGGLWCASRSWMALVSLTLPYARDGGGLASGFLGHPRARWPIALVGLVGSVGLVVAWRPVPGVVALAAGLVAAGGVTALARRRLGGFTGDVLGAAGLAAETAGLIVAAAAW